MKAQYTVQRRREHRRDDCTVDPNIAQVDKTEGREGRVVLSNLAQIITSHSPFFLCIPTSASAEASL